MPQKPAVVVTLLVPLFLFAGALSATAARAPNGGLHREKHTVRETLFVDGNDPACDDIGGDPAFCTIQAAVDAAGAGDMIQVAAGVYGENVLIPSGSDLTITGADASSTIVNGGGAERAFRIFSSSTVTLTHLGITNGNFSLGAGIYIFDSDVRIERSLLYGNEAGTGGGLFAFDSDVTIQNCAIFDNGAIGDGGGIAVEGDGSLVVDGSAVTSNEANRGGGVYALDVRLDVSDSEVMSNTAASEGGGIFRNRGYLGVFDSVIQGNTATLGSGGGVATDDDPAAGALLEIDNTRILSNTADFHGGGVYLGNGSMKSLSLQDSYVMYNRSESDGGGLNVEDGLVIISGSVLEGNRAADDGGAVYIFSPESSAVVENVLARGNRAGDDGGAIFANAEEGAALQVNRSLFVDNGAGGEGGAFFAERLDVTQSTVASNTATYGGAFYVEVALTGYNSTVSGNLAQEQGGGIYTRGYLDLHAMTIVSNTAGSGGGVDFGDASGDVQKSLIAHNVATGGAGPDCRADAGADVTSLGYNLVGIANGCDGVFLDGQNGDQAGSFGNPLDAGILPLADNGGYALPDDTIIPTHALHGDSPAVDVIPAPTYCAADQTDQRGFPRMGQDGNGDGGTDGNGCDVGAFEREGQFPIFLPISLR